MIVRSTRIRLLEKWAEKLPAQKPEEVEHAVQVFAQARFGASKATARKYAQKVLELLGLTKEDDDPTLLRLPQYSAEGDESP
jgi:hypothetical protein